MLIVSANQMSFIEENAQRDGLTIQRMMENAGSAAAEFIRNRVEVNGRYVTVFSGNGNNGGDGFVCARKLYEAGADVAVILTDGAPKNAHAKQMLSLLSPMNISVSSFGEDPEFLTDRLAATDYLVDAVYGTGFHGELDEKHQAICRLINGIGVKTFSLDIPTGLTCDTGYTCQHTVRADYTIVFDSMKPATVFPACSEYCGETTLVDIGIPEHAREDILSNYELVDAGFVFGHLKKRERNSHKGTYGKLLNVAGSQPYMGAAALSTLAALRTGVGYATLASTKEVCRSSLSMIPEAVMLPLNQNAVGGISASSFAYIKSALSVSTAVLVGNGVGKAPETDQIIYSVIRAANCPTIIDADGINAVAENINILGETNTDIILTPHLMEFSRLSGHSIEEIQKNPTKLALEFAAQHNVILVLKGAYTYTITPAGKTYINTTGNAGLAKAGSGDVLAGIIGALAAQGHPPEIAASCGAWLHGAAGDLAALKSSQYGMLIREVIEQLGNVFLAHGR